MMRSWVIAIGGALVALLATGGCEQLGGAVGWRGDGTGRYLDAAGPIKWSPSGPFVWKTRLPKWSNASPVIAGDKVFVCAEPSSLLCVDGNSGRILWERENTLEEVLTEKQKARMEAANLQAKQIQDELAPLERERRRIADQLKKTPDNAGLKERGKELETQIAQAKQKLDAILEDIYPRTQKTNGYTSPTPTSDGEYVYALFGTGVAACYDMYGNRRWIRLVQKPTHEYGHSSSPLLVGDKLIIHVRDIFGLDAATGETIWRAKSEPHWGSILHVRIADVDLAVSSHGDVVRISDGKLLAAGLQPLDYNSPAIKDGVIYFIQHDGKAVKLSSPSTGSIEIEVLWKTSPPDDRYYGSPLVHQGLIYVIHRTNMFSVIDASTGEVVYSRKLNLGRGTTYPSITLGGKYIYVSIDNGTTLVLEPGREYKEIARNRLEKFRTCPVFVGKRMFIRGQWNLYCVGE